MDIKGLAAVVTGGGSGMGAEVARHLAKAGAKVAVLDINKENVEAVAKEIGGLGLVCDVTNEESALAALAAAHEAHGPVRVLMNCAGIAPGARVVGKDGPHDLGFFSKVIGVNLIGTFNMLRLAAAEMSTQDALNDTGERGVIINTASVAAYEGQIGQAAYAASKGGVVGLTLPAARELARFGVRVVTIAPGLISTPMLGGMTPEVQESLIATTIFPKRLGLPAEFAKLALHVIDNALINGETIRLDGAVRLAPK
ncbi:MAG: SDR family NAD(P)-dependent oxidoreductase [Bdellovibrionales bacterium]|jgi:NAD(P)-dependent dehydrogenase (short-subunit alcohol dehydrogenase family)|nr:SDR family NAD(P)-dependent oxidoreductase [Bdellovibrionales bacterium]